MITDRNGREGETVGKLETEEGKEMKNESRTE